MAQLLVLSSAHGGGPVLPSLELLSHRVRQIPAEPAQLVNAPSADVVRRLEAAATEKERLVHAGRELYAWHPDGVGRSKLATLMSGKGLGVTGTARNWTTVTKLLELAG